MFLVARSKGAINLNIWLGFRKLKSLQFPTHGNSWGRLGYGMHEKLQPTAFPSTTANFDEFKEKHQQFSTDKGVGSVL